MTFTKGICWFIGWVFISIFILFFWQYGYESGPVWVFGGNKPSLFTIFGALASIAACWAVGFTGLFSAVGK